MILFKKNIRLLGILIFLLGIILPLWGGNTCDDISPSELKSQILNDKKFTRWSNFQSFTRIEEYSSNLAEGKDINIGNVKGSLEEVKLRIIARRLIEKDIVNKHASKNKITIQQARIELIRNGDLKRFWLRKKIGNCSECVDGAAPSLKERHPEIKSIDSVANRIYDHNFLVVNRDKTTDIKFPDQWNQDALVVDPWIGRVFTMDEFNAGQPIDGLSFFNPLENRHARPIRTYALLYRIDE